MLYNYTVQQYFFHTVLVSFLCGVALRTVFSISLLVAGFVALLAVGLLALWSRQRETTSAPLVLGFSLILLSISLGLWRTDSFASNFGVSDLQSQLGNTVTLQGVVVEEPDVREKSVHLMLQTESDLVLVTTNLFSDIEYGDVVEVKGKINVPKSFASDVGREFDYPHYLLAKGVEYTVSYGAVTRSSRGEGNFVIAALLRAKQAMLSSIQNVIPEPQAGLGEGLLLGVKQAMGADLEKTFRTAGIVHIIVLSGYNIMLIISFSMYLLARFFSKRVRLMVGLSLIICFALMVGLSATVVRASVMAGIFIVAQLLNRTYDLVRSLLFAAAVMVFINPYLLLYDIGFQLSFMATLGLVLITPKLDVLSPHLFGAKEYLLSTVATQIAVLPLLLYYMGEISVVAIIVNLLVLPMVPLAMLTTFIASVIGFISTTLALPVAFLAYLSLSYIVAIARTAAALPFALVNVSYFPVSFILIFYGALGAVLVWLSRPRMVEVDTLSGWVIEEEIEMTGKERSSLPVITEPPLFFR